MWYSIVQKYSGLAITRESDRLPALAGIATIFSAKLESLYLAGIWQDDLTAFLSWSQSPLHTASGRSLRIPSLPTWSWASLAT